MDSSFHTTLLGSSDDAEDSQSNLSGIEVSSYILKNNDRIYQKFHNVRYFFFRLHLT